MRKLSIDPLEFSGNFVAEGIPKVRGNRKDRTVVLKCTICDKHFTSLYANAKRTQQKTCSNVCGGVLTRKTPEGNENSIHYSKWQSMKSRCDNPNNVRYSRYGARGITYAEEFKEFSRYEEYIISLPNYKLNPLATIDRKDNNLSYVRGNLRWSSPNTQAANKTSKKHGTSSKYVGVYFCTTHSTWIACIMYEGKYLLRKYFTSEIAAIDARNTFITDNNLPHPVQSII